MSMSVYMYKHMSVYGYVKVPMHMCIYVCMNVCVWTYVCKCACECICVCVNATTCAHMCVFSVVKMLGIWWSPFCKGRFSLGTIMLLPCHTVFSLALDCIRLPLTSCRVKPRQLLRAGPVWSRKETAFLQEAQHGPMGAQTRLCRLGQVSAIWSPLGDYSSRASHVPLC